MKKRLIAVLVVLAAAVGIAFTQESNLPPSYYVAKTEEKEYTVTVEGKTRLEKHHEWEITKKTYKIFAKSRKEAENIAISKFKRTYGNHSDFVKNVVAVSCTEDICIID